jgi:ATP-dependent Lhr-like helicase
VRHDDRRVIVEPAPRGKQPTWGGFLPQYLGFALCQRILRVLRSEERYAYLDDAAWSQLSLHREQVAEVLDSDVGGIEFGRDEIRWWTFAGGRINTTIRYAIQALEADWKVVPDNFLIKIQNPNISDHRFREVLAEIRKPAFWQNDVLWAEVAESLPNYRLSKFQPLMPDWVEREVVAHYLLDVEAAAGWLGGQSST